MKIYSTMKPLRLTIDAQIAEPYYQRHPRHQ